MSFVILSAYIEPCLLAAFSVVIMCSFLIKTTDKTEEVERDLMWRLIRYLCVPVLPPLSKNFNGGKRKKKFKGLLKTMKRVCVFALFLKNNNQKLKKKKNSEVTVLLQPTVLSAALRFAIQTLTKLVAVCITQLLSCKKIPCS